jgi:stage II sporulation protein D
MRPFTALTALLAAFALVATARGVLLPQSGGSGSGSPSAGSSDPVFVVTGSGNGHGVGMSQYGALAQAREGLSAADILAF